MAGNCIDPDVSKKSTCDFVVNRAKKKKKVNSFVSGQSSQHSRIKFNREFR